MVAYEHLAKLGIGRKGRERRRGGLGRKRGDEANVRPHNGDMAPFVIHHKLTDRKGGMRFVPSLPPNPSPSAQVRGSSAPAPLGAKDPEASTKGTARAAAAWGHGHAAAPALDPGSIAGADHPPPVPSAEPARPPLLCSCLPLLCAPAKKGSSWGV